MIVRRWSQLSGELFLNHVLNIKNKNKYIQCLYMLEFKILKAGHSVYKCGSEEEYILLYMIDYWAIEIDM